MNKERIELFAGIALVVVVLVAVYMFAPSGARAPLATPTAYVEQVPPPLTPAIAAALAKSHGFEVLISYTDAGFEPATVTVKRGDTVRFVNNSSGQLWVAATGESGTLYPGNKIPCGQSAFDSCVMLEKHDFWEFTFDERGTWSYKNNARAAVTGVISVK